MHDLDSTLDAAEAELEAFGVEDFESELETEYEGDFEGEFDDELEVFADRETGGVFDQGEEMELAAELLTVSDEDELEQFLGKLIKKVGRRVKKFAKSSTGRALGGILKAAARKALPIAGRAAGSFLGGPAGAALGGKLATAAGRKFFGLELEGLSPDEQELEVARQFVRFSASAAKKAALAPGGASATQIARTAAKSAARKHAPGLVSPGRSAAAARGSKRGGRWIRRGGKIIVLGA